jgi:hypothetical protein
LSTAENSERHTAENLKEHLRAVVEDWDLQDYKIYVTTDNAANICKAVQLSSMNHVKCFAHTINLAVQKGVQLISDHLAGIRRIVTYFHKSSVAANTLKVCLLMLTNRYRDMSNMLSNMHAVVFSYMCDSYKLFNNTAR